jgi:hypothetical protein
LNCNHYPSSNPNSKFMCVKCHRVMYYPRNPSLERNLSMLAAAAGGHIDTGGLDEYADRRALEHPDAPKLRVEVDWFDNARQELGDFRNYAIWWIQGHWEAYLAGDPIAASEVDRGLRALQHAILAWRAMHTEAH